MCDKHAEHDDYIVVQIEMFDAAKQRGFPPTVLARKSGLNAQTIATWAKGVAMPAWAFSILCRHLPDDISSMMFERSEKVLAPVEPEESALDEFVCEAAELVGHYAKARHPNSPGGIRIVHTEEIPLKERVRRLGAMAAGAGK